jgi:hypothetical protein
MAALRFAIVAAVFCEIYFLKQQKISKNRSGL